MSRAVQIVANRASDALKHAAFLSLILVAGSCAGSAEVPPVALALPVQCTISETCLVQKLVDHDSGPGRQDYRCGLLTTDGHDGIDIRLRTMADMQEGHKVIAAAAGEVLRTRDGEPDISVHQRGDLNGKDAGNSVLVDHGGGWQTQYSHLRQGSVTVRPGQRIARGDVLGLIGMSGNAEFPHLHFSLSYQGQKIDPFVGDVRTGPCKVDAKPKGFWTAGAAQALSYQPTTVITSGLASQVPPRSVADRPLAPAIASAHEPLVMWVDVIGARDGDIQAFAITGPSGRPVHAQETKVAKGGLSWFAYSGKRAPPQGWPAGQYAGSYTLMRDGKIVARSQASGHVR
ncbi:MAG: M23 family metallopeptidase [Sphingorhabdus sp.]